MPSDSKNKKWWDGAVVYQVYLRSFYDSDGNGVGDLRGLIEKLDYLRGGEDSLGVNAVWISPFYPSPMADFGYDVSDYCAVDTEFGTMEDFDELLAEAHKRDIKLVLDFIPNHTSDQHPWFLESKSAKNNPKRNWYVWKDCKKSGPPNNWISSFGGSAWQFDKTTGQYYLHTFLKEQPDLNWDNPAVRQNMLANMKFWLDKGVDGFRVDAVSWLSKEAGLKDEPKNPDFKNGQDPYFKLLHHFSREGPRLYDYLNEMIDCIAKYEDRFMITEAYPDSDDSRNYYANYYKHLRHRICAPFNFEAITSEWSASAYRSFINRLQNALQPDQIPIYVMGNHDKPRLASRLSHEVAPSAAMLQLTLPGMPFIYYGEELGMSNASGSKSTDVKDPYTTAKNAGRPQSRTPMQWSCEKNAGFSTGQPWLPLSQDYERFNVESESEDSHSFLNLYRTLIKLRSRTPAIKHGEYEPVESGERLLAFYRTLDNDRYLVVINFSDETAKLNPEKYSGHVLLSTYMDRFDMPTVRSGLKLRPHEGLVIKT